MGERAIKDLEKVLSARIGKHKKITDVKMEPLTAPGENYGSIMSKLDLTVEDQGTKTELHAVAKQIPAQEFARALFNIQVTFKNEIAVYDTIVPLLQDFQRENGVDEVIDCFTEMYGARINLGEENGTVDEDAVLILENLNFTGYEVVDRHTGFDLETTLLILKDLAAFHAVPLALKLRKPQVFDEKIRPYLAPFKPPDFPNQDKHDAVILEILQDSYKCIPWIPKVKEIFENQKTTRGGLVREPFATITHGDMWVNNTMVKFQNGVPVHNKIIDFQVIDYKSPAVDLIFFLFSSVKLSVLRDNLDDFIQQYHKHFVSHLEQLKCDTTPFTFPKLLEEIKASMDTEIPHTVGMSIFIIFGKKGGPSKEFNHETPPDWDKIRDNVSLEAKEKVRYMIQACGERGWL
ncbi:hypothetical protein NQ315_004291 [Exocentrus adspersus]|uniref:CHK kinase-like domain-containing protein n=1 Tax=Exocentrus adspersus TaxID=1586481 RepID=A0AAV8W7E6_9CUCU|nr:hypothetical protein NQ315_004291 [Exocentrus adspersus]